MPFRRLFRFAGADTSTHDSAQQLIDRGIAAERTGALDAAVAAYEQAIAVDPKNASAHYDLALVRLKLDDFARAERSFRSALDLRLPFPEAWVGLATAVEALGRDDDALAALERAIAERPDYAGALFNAAALLRKRGRLDTAIAYVRRALAVEPEHYLEHARLGADLATVGRFADAEASWRAALALKSDVVETHRGLANALIAQGRNQEALHVLFDAVAQSRGDPEAIGALVDGLSGVVLLSADARERDILRRLCLDDSVSMRYVNTALIGLLKGDEAFARLLDIAQRREEPLAHRDPAIDRCLRDPFVCAALTRLPVTDPALEQVLTHLRRSIVLQDATRTAGRRALAIYPHAFACAMAGQCFTSGYAFFADDDELAHVRSIRQVVEAALQEPALDVAALEQPLTTIAMYDYLDTLSGCDRLSTVPGEWSESFRPIARQQIEDRRRERELAAAIDRLTVIGDPVSLEVRRQYEAHPYPVWTGVHRIGPDTVEALMHRLRPDRPAPPRMSPAHILVAGCGTGEQSVQTARTYPQGEILAIDLSLASLAYAARMTEKHGITNVTYRQADILELSSLDQRFAVIECTGVLHHLHDPLAGWRVLVHLLEPEGLMRVALYSESARRTLDAATDYLRSLQLPTTADGTRRGRRAIIALPDGHPAKAAMTFGDFYTLNGCRDLLMHAEEHRFTLPQVAECLDALSLRFLGMQCSSETQARFLDMFGDRQAAGDLRAWDRFEEAYPATFTGMYSFWCCRKDSAD